MTSTRGKWVGPPECGHPNRAHFAKGKCQQCYMKDYDTARSEKRKQERRKDPSEYAPNYRRPKHDPPRIPDCHPDRPHVAHGLCTACYQRENREKPRATCHPERAHRAGGLCTACYSRQHYDQDPETARRVARESHAKARKRLRDELVEAYGGRCACTKCPETNLAFLTLEHVNGDGGEHRKRLGSHVYEDLRRRGWPQEGYTLLCWNCNAMTRNGRTCPHEEN